MRVGQASGAVTALTPAVCCSSEGVLRRLKNLCLGALLEAVRDRTKSHRLEASQSHALAAALEARNRIARSSIDDHTLWPCLARVKRGRCAAA